MMCPVKLANEMSALSGGSPHDTMRAMKLTGRDVAGDAKC
jgi:hypothetical protein